MDIIKVIAQNKRPTTHNSFQVCRIRIGHEVEVNFYEASTDQLISTVLRELKQYAN